MADSVDPDQTAPIGAVCSGSTLFALILNLSVMLGNFLQQTTSADDIVRCIFSWRFKGKWHTHLIAEMAMSWHVILMWQHLETIHTEKGPSHATLFCRCYHTGCKLSQLTGSIDWVGSSIPARFNTLVEILSWKNFYSHSPPFRWIIQEGLLSVTSESKCTNYW